MTDEDRARTAIGTCALSAAGFGDIVAEGPSTGRPPEADDDTIGMVARRVS